MKLRHTLVMTGSLALVLAVLSPADGNQDDTSPASEGIEILARGPVHEAYANPATSKPAPSPVVAKAPPKAIEEVPPDQKPEGENVQWIPGYWSWDDEKNDYIWVSGFWRQPPPDRRWMPGSWRQTDGGWQWASGFWAPQQKNATNYVPTPPEPLDNGPGVPAPSDDHLYVPGSWIYRDARFVWRPGFWTAGRPNWIWVQAHYVWTPLGYVFVDGYWDYLPEDRGVLFAPICVTDPFLFRRWGWCYTPCYVIQPSCLFGSLFVRPNYGCYWFGDYFGAGYRRAGFCPWIDVRVGGWNCDPFFSHYRWQNRGWNGWEGGMRNLYAGRDRGDFARPPRTLGLQDDFVKNAANGNGKGRPDSVLLASLDKLDKKEAKLQPLSEERRQAERQQGRELNRLALERRKLETDALAKGPVSSNLTTTAREAKLDLPRPVNPKGESAVDAKKAGDPKTPNSLTKGEAKNASPASAVVSNLPAKGEAKNAPPPPAPVAVSNTPLKGEAKNLPPPPAVGNLPQKGETKNPPPAPVAVSNTPLKGETKNAPAPPPAPAAVSNLPQKGEAKNAPAPPPAPAAVSNTPLKGETRSSSPPPAPTSSSTTPRAETKSTTPPTTAASNPVPRMESKPAPAPAARPAAPPPSAPAARPAPAPPAPAARPAPAPVARPAAPAARPAPPAARSAPPAARPAPARSAPAPAAKRK